MNSQDDSHCELAVSFPWVCNSHGELTVSYSWDQPMSSPCSGSSELTVRVANPWKAHSKLTFELMESSQQAHSVSSSCEFAVWWTSGFKMSLSWVIMWAHKVLVVSSNSSLGFMWAPSKLAVSLAQTDCFPPSTSQLFQVTVSSNSSLGKNDSFLKKFLE